MKQRKCGCNPVNFDCVCDWVKKNPGTNDYNCSFCGIYTASKPRCNECQCEEREEGRINLTKNEAICMWSAVNSMRTGLTGDLADICNSLERGLKAAGFSLDGDEEEMIKIANDDDLLTKTLDKVIRQFDGAKGSGPVEVHFQDHEVENIRTEVGKYEDEES